MRFEITRPVGGWTTRTTVGAELEGAFQMPQFDAEPCERCERIDDQPTAITGNVIADVGIGLCPDSTVDADRVGDPLVLPPGVRLTSLGTGRGVAERTADEGLLHHSPSSPASRQAVQPRWKTTSCVDESNAAPLGS